MFVLIMFLVVWIICKVCCVGDSCWLGGGLCFFGV